LGPLVEGVEELLGQVDGGLPLLEVLELQRGTCPGLEYQGDIVRVDRSRGELAVVDGLERAHVREVDVNRLADAGGLRLDVLVDRVQERGAADFGLVVLVGPGHQGLEKRSKIVGHEWASLKSPFLASQSRADELRKNS